MNRLPSVTTVLGVLSKDGLPWAAARETAVYAAEHIDEWVSLPTPDAIDKLRKFHRGVWDHRACLGTATHQVNEAWARGEAVDLDAVVEQVAVGNRIWQGRDTSALADELGVLVDGLSDAWSQLKPETLSVEDVVRYPHSTFGYIGQADWRARIAGRVWLIDLKTTGELDPQKALYWDSWRLQLAAYRYCTEKVHYNQPRVHRPYAKGVEEVSTSPLPTVDGAAILHIRANGEWGFYPVAAGRDEHDLFLGLRHAWGWLNGDGKRPGSDANEAAA